MRHFTEKGVETSIMLIFIRSAIRRSPGRNHSARLRKLAVLIAAATLASGVAIAGTTAGTIMGTVKDPQGRPFPARP
jgi:hypothetical protein